MTVGERIKARRQELGLSQEELAKRMGNTSRASVSTVETGREDLTTTRVQKFADALDTTPAYLMGWDILDPTNEMTKYLAAQNNLVEMRDFYEEKLKGKTSTILAPVLGRVAAGVPIEMITDILDTEELDPKDFPPGDYFGLVIKGDSMEPKISEGDVVIVRQQPDVESGQIAIVTVNGDDATCKKVMKYGDHLMLTSFNPDYKPMQFSKEDVEKLPVRILGRVVESRAKF